MSVALLTLRFILYLGREVGMAHIRRKIKLGHGGVTARRQIMTCSLVALAGYAMTASAT